MSLPVLSAIAAPIRLQALRLVSDATEHGVCEPMKEPAATQGRLSWHMQVPRQAGLVVVRRDAPWVRNRLNPDMPPALRAVDDAVLAAASGTVDERNVA